MSKPRMVPLLVGVAAAFLLSVGSAYAGIISIGVNFGAVADSDPNAATRNLAPTDAAGVVPATNWNNLLGATGMQAGLTANDGLPSAAPTA